MVTDGVFSMDGDIAPLDRLTEVADRYGVLTMVDDAHGEGVLGKGGRGIVDHFGLHGAFDVEIGTLSKAFGVVGGVIAGKKAIVDFIRQKARPFLFSSATTPADTAACLAAVDLLEESEALVEKLWDNAAYFRAEMQRLGFDTGTIADADRAGDAGRCRAGEAVQPGAVRGGCLRHARSASRRCRRAWRASV